MYLRRLGMASIGCAFLASIFACGGGSNAPANKSASVANGDTDNRWQDAAVEGRVLAAAALKYPLDAEFEEWRTTASRTGDYTYIATGRVKAANAFGAKLTRDYAVHLELTGESHNQWYVTRIVIGDEVILSRESAAAGAARKEAFSEIADNQAKAAAQREAEAEAMRWRELADTTGKFKVRAKVLGFKDNKVEIIKEDGTRMEVVMEKFAESDRKWIREQIKFLNADEPAPPSVGVFGDLSAPPPKLVPRTSGNFADKDPAPKP